MFVGKRTLALGAFTATLLVVGLGCTGPNQQRNPLALRTYDGRVQLLIATCDDDPLLESARLAEVGDNGRIHEKDEGDDREIWSISSPDPVRVSEPIVLGSVPEGFTGTAVPIDLKDGVTYGLDVKSKAYLSLTFDGGRLTGDKIYTDEGTFDSRSAWLRSVRGDLC